MKKKCLKTFLSILTITVFGIGFTVTVRAAAPSYDVSEKREGNMIHKTLTVTEVMEGETVEPVSTRIFDGDEYELVSTEVISLNKDFRDGKEILYEKEYELVDKDISVIPEHLEEDGITYTLNQDTIIFEAGSYDTKKEVADHYIQQTQPDNDIDRIEKNIQIAGSAYSLTGVTYTVASTNDYGIPTSYTADCCYSTLVTKEVPVTYIARTQYTGHEKEEYIVSSEVRMIYECDVEKKPVNTAVVVTAAAGGGAVCFGVFLFVFFGMYISVYSLNKDHEYEYLGKAKLKKNAKSYKVIVTKQLVDKAWSSEYMIRFRKKQIDYVGSNLVEIRLSDGKGTFVQAKKETTFCIH